MWCLSPLKTKEKSQSKIRISHFIYFILIICVLTSFSGFTISCDFVVNLNIENHMPFDIQVIYSEHYSNGRVIYRHASDIIPVGKTGTIGSGIINGISAVAQIVLQAEDPSGKVVWQKTWSGQEFGKLATSGPFNIIVSPETNSS